IARGSGRTGLWPVSATQKKGSSPTASLSFSFPGPAPAVIQLAQALPQDPVQRAGAGAVRPLHTHVMALRFPERTVDHLVGHGGCEQDDEVRLPDLSLQIAGHPGKYLCFTFIFPAYLPV